MKWFTIDTDIAEDPKIQMLIHRHGLDAFAVWNLTLTKVAKEIDFENERNGYYESPNEIDPCEFLSCSFPIDEERIREIFSACAKLELIDPDEWKNGEIYFPKLLEREQVRLYLKQQEGGQKGGMTSKPGQQGDLAKDTLRSPSRSPSRTPSTDRDQDRYVQKTGGTERQERDQHAGEENEATSSDSTSKSTSKSFDESGREISHELIRVLTMHGPTEQKAANEIARWYEEFDRDYVDWTIVETDLSKADNPCGLIQWKLNDDENWSRYRDENPRPNRPVPEPDELEFEDIMEIPDLVEEWFPDIRGPYNIMERYCQKVSDPELFESYCEAVSDKLENRG